MGKGSKRRQENFKKVQENWDIIDWDTDKNSFPKDVPCYICGSKPGESTEFKDFCALCGNRD
jgi:hypothetical protein